MDRGLNSQGVGLRWKTLEISKEGCYQIANQNEIKIPEG